ncbi:MAG TPA: methyltransferase domain-containing protein [Geobacteraceae bacterium]|nr:methyltransferase domain-containing protein [Geobacteraceae bacterium]
MEQWNPDSYLKYEYERTLPSRDLAARIEFPDPERVIDIGCGPGNSTKILRDRWPNAAIAGLDSSEEMIQKARATYPAGEWIIADAESWNPEGGYDIVFSNAALQWMSNQEAVIARLFGYLKNGGALAVQVPMNNDSPIHKALIAVAESDVWRQRLLGCESRIIYNDESFYYNILSTLTPRMELWITTYLHFMDSHRDIIDWYASTGLKPYLGRMDTAEEKEKFKRQTLEKCKGQYPVQRDGKVIFPFKRLFFIAWKCGNH